MGNGITLLPTLLEAFTKFCRDIVILLYRDKAVRITKEQSTVYSSQNKGDGNWFIKKQTLDMGYSEVISQKRS